MIYFVVGKCISKSIVESQLIQMVQYVLAEKKIVFRGSNNFVATMESVASQDPSALFKDGDVVYTRQFEDFFNAYKARFFYGKKIKIIYNFRGLVSQESWMKHSSYTRRFVLSALERLVYALADEVIVVSKGLKQYLEKKFGHRKSEVIVMPCSVARNYLKKNFSTDRLRFLYLGGFHVWQKPVEAIRIFELVKKKYPNAVLNIITYDTPSLDLKKLIDMHGIELMSLPYEKVLDALRSYDFGFILRDDTLMNQISSPIKFAEYIAMGVVPIVSPGVGDYYQLSKDQGIAIRTDSEFKFKIDDLDEILNDPNIHKRLFEASQDFIWKKSANIFLKKLESPLSQE